MQKARERAGSLHGKVRAGSSSEDQTEPHRAEVMARFSIMITGIGYAFKDLQLFVSCTDRNNILQKYKNIAHFSNQMRLT